MTDKPKPTNDGQPAEPAAAPQEPAASDEPKVPRAVLQQQGAEWKTKFASQEAELSKLRLEKEERETAKLKKAENWEAIEKKHLARIQELETANTTAELNRKRGELKMQLVGSGLRPDDPRDELVINGIMGQYDGETEVSDWFGKYKLENAAVFEQAPTYTQTGAAANAAPPSAAPSEVDNLIVQFNKGDMDAATKLDQMNKAGTLTQEMKIKMGVA